MTKEENKIADKITLEEVIETLQTWIATADDEYDREEMGRVCGLKEALHELKKIEPCTDAISRKDVMNLAHDIVIGDYRHRCIDATVIKELPSVNPQRWIPVSERLPEKDGSYLITYESDLYNKQCFVTALEFECGKWFYDDDYKIIDYGNCVIAWMPLPNPYEPQESEEEGGE